MNSMHTIRIQYLQMGLGDEFRRFSQLDTYFTEVTHTLSHSHLRNTQSKRGVSIFDIDWISSVATSNVNVTSVIVIVRSRSFSINKKPKSCSELRDEIVFFVRFISKESRNKL